MTDSGQLQIAQLNRRARDVLRQIVESYMDSGEPIGSRTISRLEGIGLSPATIRNVMADLEDTGLLFSPHTSAGRLPTEAGLRLFVDGLLEIGGLTEDERKNIDAQCAAAGITPTQVLEQATDALAGLSHHAGLVAVPKQETPLKQIEFVSLSPDRALAVLVFQDGTVENRLLDVPLGVTTSALTEASNYLNSRLVGRTLVEARTNVMDELAAQRAQLDAITSDLVERGLADWSGDGKESGVGSLIIRGHAKLLDDVAALDDLERVRRLFEVLDSQETLVKLVDLAQDAEGVQIFIGSENELFNHAGCSMIIAPYRNSEERVIGAVGVIGPTRMNYGRIIPMVDYTAQVVGRLIG
jgi:heat-inducible transcriptional repressor